MENLPIQELSNEGIRIYYQSAKESGNLFNNDGETFVIAINNDISQKTLTFIAKNECNQYVLNNIEANVEAGKKIIIGPLDKEFYNEEGKVEINYSDVTDLKIAVIKLGNGVINLSIARITEILEVGNEIGNSVDNGKKTITTSSTKIFSENNRTYLALTNVNQYDVWIGLGETAVVDEGILLSAYGGAIVFTKDDIYKGDIYMIADGGSNDIAYVEGVY